MQATAQWLAIVGIGEDGLDGLGVEARQRIAEAEVVFGGGRHLALVASIVTGEARPWPSPFDAEMRAVIELRGRKICVLASGDPFCHGVGTTLARHIATDGDANDSRAVRLLACRRPARLGAAGSGDGVAARQAGQR